MRLDKTLIILVLAVIIVSILLSGCINQKTPIKQPIKELTEEDKVKLTEIALNDTTIKECIRGDEYEIDRMCWISITREGANATSMSVIEAEDISRAKVAYNQTETEVFPGLVIYVGDPSCMEIIVVIDLIEKEVVDVLTYYLKPYPPIPTNESEFRDYLHYRKDYRGGEETKVFLIDSYARYGAYYRDLPSWWSPSAKRGDPCVIINGTIRNDYDKDYYIPLSADVFNSRGEQVGTVISYNAALPGFTEVYVKSGYTAPFEMQIKYGGEDDIVHYDIFVEYQPTEWPLP